MRAEAEVADALSIRHVTPFNASKPRQGLNQNKFSPFPPLPQPLPLKGGGGKLQVLDDMFGKVFNQNKRLSE